MLLSLFACSSNNGRGDQVGITTEKQTTEKPKPAVTTTRDWKQDVFGGWTGDGENEILNFVPDGTGVYKFDYEVVMGRNETVKRTAKYYFTWKIKEPNIVIITYNDTNLADRTEEFTLYDDFLLRDDNKFFYKK